MDRKELPWLAVVLGLAGCGEPAAPSYHDPIVDLQPRPLEEVARAWLGPGQSVELREEDDTVWVVEALAQETWSRDEDTGLWTTPVPVGGAFAWTGSALTQLLVPGRTLRRVQSLEAPTEGDYRVHEGRIALAVEEAPATATFGARVEGALRSGERWRTSSERLVADGFPVWSGTRETLELPTPDGSTLTFVTRWAGPLAEEATLRVLDGTGERLSVALGEEPRPVRMEDLESGAITFEVTGPPGRALVMQPMGIPAEVGTYRDRPWGEDRPDVVLFLADTLRADMLAIHGGDPTWMPRTNELAQSSVRFLQARSASSWTLPSISSLLTGLHPGQHAATDEDTTLSHDLVTIAELFAANGYRTGAITDHSFFGHDYVLDQGFSWFQETMFPHWDLSRTVDDALAFLDRDDGRPVFLVVHSYRAHAPYRTGPEEDLSGWDALMERSEEMVREERAIQPAGSRARALLRAAPEMRALYDRGVQDLDQEFGRLADGIRSRGLLESGYLVFTSDHGEAFGENEDMGHGKKLWDVKIRVPLLVTGRDLAPRDVPHTVSTIDLAPTLAELCALAGRPNWPGGSLLEVDADRASYSYLLEENRQQLALVQGSRKLFSEPTVDALRARRVLEAFDLAQDPGEATTLEPDWLDELCEVGVSALDHFLTPAAQPGTIGVFKPDLRGIGYGGE